MFIPTTSCPKISSKHRLILLSYQQKNNILTPTRDTWKSYHIIKPWAILLTSPRQEKILTHITSNSKFQKICTSATSYPEISSNHRLILLFYHQTKKILTRNPCKLSREWKDRLLNTFSFERYTLDPSILSRGRIQWKCSVPHERASSQLCWHVTLLPVNNVHPSRFAARYQSPEISLFYDGQEYTDGKTFPWNHLSGIVGPFTLCFLIVSESFGLAITVPRSYSRSSALFLSMYWQ